MKRWFDVEVTRVIRNSKGESLRRNTQHTIVWATAETALGLAFRRCSDPFSDDDRHRDTYCEVTELADNYDMQGRKMEAVIEEVEPGSVFGLDAEDLEKLTGGAEA